MTLTTTNPDRAEISRSTAQKSHGPRTPEGRNRSKFNAVKHGMTAHGRPECMLAFLVNPVELPNAGA